MKREVISEKMRSVINVNINQMAAKKQAGGDIIIA